MQLIDAKVINGPLYPLRLTAGPLVKDGFTDEVIAVTDVRYHVPGHYGVGPSFPTLAEAAAHAQSTITTFDYEDSETHRPSQSRAFVELRANFHYKGGGSQDAPVERIEVFLP